MVSNLVTKNKETIYLTAKGETEGFTLPVLPPEIGKDLEGEVEHFKVQEGLVTTLSKTPDPVEISWESFFPSESSDRFRSDGKKLEPSHYISQVEAWLRSDEPVRFIFTGGLLTINILVKVTMFNSWVEGADPDVHYEIRLVEYNPEVVKELEIKDPPMIKPGSRTLQGLDDGEVFREVQTYVLNDKPTRSPEIYLPGHYTTGEGESLYLIARRLSGDGGRMGEIASLNGLTDDLILDLPSGLTLKVPESWRGE